MLNRTYSNVNFFQKALDATWLRNEAISNNIANVNTPGYKRATVEFENILKDKMIERTVPLRTTNIRHIGKNNSIHNINPKIKINKEYSTKHDKNNVNIDVEMANLAKNTIMYNAIVNQTSREFEKIKSVISEGGR